MIFTKILLNNKKLSIIPTNNLNKIIYQNKFKKDHIKVNNNKGILKKKLLNMRTIQHQGEK